ncbi:MAG: hypothetical protein R3C53_02215 [Pirellulaceae bacterium]
MEPKPSMGTIELAGGRWSAGRNLLRKLTQIAAVLCVAGFFGLLILFKSVNRLSAQRDLNQLARTEIRGGTSDLYDLDGEESADWGRRTESTGKTDNAETSTFALGSFRDHDPVATIPSPPSVAFSLHDDVQYDDIAPTHHFAPTPDGHDKVQQPVPSALP